MSVAGKGFVATETGGADGLGDVVPLVGGDAGRLSRARICCNEVSCVSGRDSLSQAAKFGALPCFERKPRIASMRRQSAFSTTARRQCLAPIRWPMYLVTFALGLFGNAVERVTTASISPARFSNSSICLPSPPPWVPRSQIPTSRRSTALLGPCSSTRITLPWASAANQWPDVISSEQSLMARARTGASPASSSGTDAWKLV